MRQLSAGVASIVREQPRQQGSMLQSVSHHLSTTVSPPPLIIIIFVFFVTRLKVLQSDIVVRKPKAVKPLEMGESRDWTLAASSTAAHSKSQPTQRLRTTKLYETHSILPKS